MNIEHLFLFEYVKKGASVSIYGLGACGNSYIQQIERTSWCNIVGVYDRKNRFDSYRNYEIEDFCKLNCDYIVIAIESKEQATLIYNELISRGVNREIILNLNMRRGSFPCPNEEKITNEILVTYVDGGGFGDVLLGVLFLSQIKKMINGSNLICLISRFSDYFSKFHFIDKVIDYQIVQDNLEIEKEKSDVFFIGHNIVLIEKYDSEIIKKNEPKLWEYCDKNHTLQDELFGNDINNFRYTKYALLNNKNRIEQMDLAGAIPILRTDLLEIPIQENTKQILKSFGVFEKKYITINRDSGSGSNKGTKLWPSKYYIDFLKYIKDTYPELVIISVGSSIGESLRKYVDVDTTGRTSLEQIEILLSNALIHIGTEGGLVHLNHFLGGVSMVFFGSTSPDVFGYPENINLTSNVCNERCECMTDNWALECPKGENEPPCMHTLYPEVAIIEFEKFMSKRGTL